MSNWPRWLVMWLIAFGLIAVLKLLTFLTFLRSAKAQSTTIPKWKYLAYLIGWPGMDTEAFLTRRGKSVSVGEWCFAVVKTLAGIGFTAYAINRLDHWPPLVAGWLGMVSITFVLHFGSFHVLSCIWRTCGCDAKPIMNWPILSTSLSEFWGKRWNLAFRDLTYQYLFHPCVKWFGPVGATSIGFVASGLVHELAITVPAGGWYGGPTFYFLLQLVGVLAERSAWGQPIRGRVYTALFLLVPVPFLFPPVFVDRIMDPFLHFLGSGVV